MKWLNGLRVVRWISNPSAGNIGKLVGFILGTVANPQTFVVALITDLVLMVDGDDADVIKQVAANVLVRRHKGEGNGGNDYIKARLGSLLDALK